MEYTFLLTLIPIGVILSQYAKSWFAKKSKQLEIDNIHKEIDNRSEAVYNYFAEHDKVPGNKETILNNGSNVIMPHLTPVGHGKMCVTNPNWGLNACVGSPITSSQHFVSCVNTRPISGTITPGMPEWDDFRMNRPIVQPAPQPRKQSLGGMAFVDSNIHHGQMIEFEYNDVKKNIQDVIKPHIKESIEDAMKQAVAVRNQALHNAQQALASQFDVLEAMALRDEAIEVKTEEDMKIYRKKLRGPSSYSIGSDPK